MGTGPFADADAGFQAIFARRSEMNATIHTAVPCFVSRIQRCWKAAIYSGEKVRANCEGKVVGAVKKREHGRGGGAERAMSGDVIRKGRRHDERHPVQFRFDEGNRRHWTPEMKLILGIPGANGGV